MKSLLCWLPAPVRTSGLHEMFWDRYSRTGFVETLNCKPSIGGQSQSGKLNAWVCRESPRKTISVVRGELGSWNRHATPSGCGETLSRVGHNDVKLGSAARGEKFAPKYTLAGGLVPR